jgi:hypothetical protein
MATYDEESLLVDIETLLKNNLNTRITALNTEKADSITLAQVDSNAYFMDMDDRHANYSPVVIYTISGIDTESIASSSLRTITINIAIIINDNGDLDIVKRMMRYGRALREVFEMNFKYIRAVSDFKISSLPVLSFQLRNTSERYKIVGLDLETCIC